MAETQKLPVFSPPNFLSRRLPPLEIPAVQSRSDHPFRSPDQLPSIRHQHYQHQEPPSLTKLLHPHPHPYTPPRSEPYSPQQYGPPISPASEFDSRTRRAPDVRYSYEDTRPAHRQHHEQPYASLASSVEPSQQKTNYELRVRQQPIAARACGFGERDRRVIDPPPIIQLLVTDPKTGVAEEEELRYSLNVVHCTLWNQDGTSEETALVQPDRRTTRRLMGQLVASPSVAKDEHDVEGCFFCFPDLSCRTHGKYRLRFVLMRIDPTNMHVGGFSPILTEVLSDVFTVYTAKDFPGMRPSSALTRALKLQGCNIQVKKGNEKALARKRLTASQDVDDDDEAGKRRRKD
ncbi:hypothetical protein M011DRAFT_394881 [Sporormia fimetaria CBS 119925]|uniref:Velvet domain-containing protein n=1 Tax=Sporormia fimetaria CBS 119925 TaxID=1340428 RepID=A0A6A6VPI2_9PLEO|nr:hypothetical protein M011DRAFT_394881 [Sporormia fimetaria CBS 119925]